MTKLAVFFTGFAAKIAGVTRPPLMQLCHEEGWEAIWLTDRSRAFYLSGADLPRRQTGHRLDRLNTRLGNRLNFLLKPRALRSEAQLQTYLRRRMARARSTVFVASSAGGYGCIHHAEALRPQACIAFAPFTAFDTATTDQDPRGVRARVNLCRIVPDDRHRNPRQRMLGADWPDRNLSIYVPLHSPGDVIQARNLLGVPGVHHIGVDSAHHNLSHDAFDVTEVLRHHLRAPDSPPDPAALAAQPWYSPATPRRLGLPEDQPEDQPERKTAPKAASQADPTT